MTEDLTAVLGQRLMEAKHQSGGLKGVPILCFDPDFNELPLTREDMLDEDVFTEEDIRELAKSSLTWLLEKLVDPKVSRTDLINSIQKAIS